MKTAKTTPKPATVTIPPPCASIAAAPPVLITVPAEAVLVPFLLPFPVDAALPEPPDPEALPDDLVLFEEPVAPEFLPVLVAVAIPEPVSVEFPEAPRVALAFLVLVLDWALSACWLRGWEQWLWLGRGDWKGER